MLGGGSLSAREWLRGGLVKLARVMFASWRVAHVQHAVGWLPVKAVARVLVLGLWMLQRVLLVVCVSIRRCGPGGSLLRGVVPGA